MSIAIKTIMNMLLIARLAKPFGPDSLPLKN